MTPKNASGTIPMAAFPASTRSSSWPAGGSVFNRRFATTRPTTTPPIAQDEWKAVLNEWKAVLECLQVRVLQVGSLQDEIATLA